MKKNGMIIIGIVVVVGLLIASFAIPDNSYDETTSGELATDANTIISNAEKESENAQKKDLKELSKITVDEYLNYYATEGGAQLVLLASPTCHYCQIAEPILKEIAQDYKLDIKYLDASAFGEEETPKFVQSDEFFAEGYGTPLLMVLGNNSIIDKVDGLTDKAHYIDFFQKNNFIE